MQFLGKTQVTKWSIGASLMPAEGPRIISSVLDFSIDGDIPPSFTADATNITGGTSEFSMVQSVYVDTSATDAAVVITVGKAGQTIIAKGRTQGWYPVTAPNSWVLKFACADVNAKVSVILANYAVSPAVWGATI